MGWAAVDSPGLSTFGRQLHRFLESDANVCVCLCELLF